MGTRSSLQKFGHKSEFSNRQMNTVLEATLQTNQGVEKVLSMNSINEQGQNDGNYRNTSSTESSNGALPQPALQPPRHQRPRSAPENNQSPDSITQVTQGTQVTPPTLQVNGHEAASPENRRMAVCAANDKAETDRRRMRVYQKRF